MDRDKFHNQHVHLYQQDIHYHRIKVTESVIKDIHSLVLMDRPNDKGIYRRIPVRIMGAFAEPVAPHFIEEEMVKLLFENERQRQAMHVVERVALFHLKFEKEILCVASYLEQVMWWRK